MPSLVRMCTVRWILLSWLRVIRVNPWLWLPTFKFHSIQHWPQSIKHNCQTYWFFTVQLWILSFLMQAAGVLGPPFLPEISAVINVGQQHPSLFCLQYSHFPAAPQPAAAFSWCIPPQNWTVVWPSLSRRLAFLWPHKTSSTEQEISGWKGFSRPWLSLLLQLGRVQFYKFQSVTYIVIDKLKDSGTPF